MYFKLLLFILKVLKIMIFNDFQKEIVENDY